MQRVTEIYRNIFRIKLPIPGKKPGPINVYLFKGEKITLLDTGLPVTEKLLKACLQRCGVDFRDIEQVIVTHGHMDHCGVADKIVKESGGKAKVLAHEEDVRQIKTGQDVEKRTVRRFLLLMGVPQKIIQSIRVLSLLFSRMIRKSRVDRIITDGDKIELGDYEGTVISTPGHTKGSVCIYLEKEGLLFSGDHIMEHITPNAFVMLDDCCEIPPRLSQVEFYNSIEIIEKLSPPIVYPAHGKSIKKLEDITGMYRRQYDQRNRLIMDILDSGDLTVYRIARDLFPELKKGIRFFLEIYLSISEVFTHLQVLQLENKVESYKRGRKLLFHKTGHCN